VVFVDAGFELQAGGGSEASEEAAMEPEAPRYEDKVSIGSTDHVGRTDRSSRDRRSIECTRTEGADKEGVTVNPLTRGTPVSVQL
jgi:hypothetical protein